MSDSNVNVAHITRKELESLESDLIQFNEEWVKEEARRESLSEAEFRPLRDAYDLAFSNYHVWTVECDIWLESSIQVEEEERYFFGLRSRTVMTMSTRSFLLETLPTLMYSELEESLPSAPESCKVFESLKEEFDPEYYGYPYREMMINAVGWSPYEESYLTLAERLYSQVKDNVLPVMPYKGLYYATDNPKAGLMEIVRDLLKVGAREYSVSPEVAKQRGITHKQYREENSG